MRLYARDLGLTYPVESVVIAAGARPLLYGAYRTLVDPGDIAIYPVPTWNNNHYAYLSGARGSPGDRLGRVELLPDARPDPPAPRDGAAPHPQLAAQPHGHRDLEGGPHGDHGAGRRGEPATRGDGRQAALLRLRPGLLDAHVRKATHHTPVELVPESAPYVVFLDAISKAFCATGMRVGWGVMPPAVRRRMSDILGHVGAWAPKAEQVGVAALLDAPEAISAFRDSVRGSSTSASRRSTAASWR